jgi:hypothetical protein
MLQFMYSSYSSSMICFADYIFSWVESNGRDQDAFCSRGIFFTSNVFQKIVYVLWNVLLFSYISVEYKLCHFDICVVAVA